MSTRKAPTIGTIIIAFLLIPYLSFTDVKLTIAVGVAPRPWPSNPAHITAAS